MNRQGLSRWCALGRPLAVFLACTGLACEGKPPTSIVLVTLDTTRADHLGIYGYHRDTSPALDAFAADAVVFENAVTTMATTLPAHVSLMTSTDTLGHGIKGNAKRGRAYAADLGLRTLAQMVGDLGYETAAFISATPLKRHAGLDAGFELYDEPEGHERPAAETTDRAIAWLRGRGEQPFFLWVHYFDPHYPYHAPSPTPFESDEASTRFLEALGALGGPIPDEDVAYLNDHYDGEIRYLDGHLGRLIAELELPGRRGSPAIVVTGDHGEGLGQHGWSAHGRIYNEQIFVPLVLKLPDRIAPPAGRKRELASVLDVLPTLVAALRLPIGAADREQLMGKNLLGESWPRDALFVERVHRDDPAWESGRKYALIDTRWKYHHLPDHADALYDWRADRHELENLAASRPAVAQVMRARTLERLAAARHADAGPLGDSLAPSTREQLKALGYAE